MKKFFTALILVSLFLIPVFHGQAVAETQAETRMLNDLLGYLYNCEMIYSDLLWALDAFDKFDAQKNWENLQFARASLEIAKSDIQKRKAPAPEMTAEDKKDFMKRGIDLSFLETVNLLKDSIEAKGKKREEAIMLLNHKEALKAIVERPDYFKSLSLARMEDVGSSKNLVEWHAVVEWETPSRWALATAPPDEVRFAAYIRIPRRGFRTWHCAAGCPAGRARPQSAARY